MLMRRASCTTLFAPTILSEHRQPLRPLRSHLNDNVHIFIISNSNNSSSNSSRNSCSVGKEKTAAAPPLLLTRTIRPRRRAAHMAHDNVSAVSTRRTPAIVAKRKSKKKTTTTTSDHAHRHKRQYNSIRNSTFFDRVISLKSSISIASSQALAVSTTSVVVAYLPHLSPLKTAAAARRDERRRNLADEVRDEAVGGLWRC